MSDGTKYPESLNRPLTKHERDLIEWLLDHPEEGNPNIPGLKAQINALTVIRKCACGCPTVHFALEGIPVQGKGARVIRDYLATVDDEQVGIVLFQNDGRLSSLEVYSMAGADKPFGLRETNTIYPWEELSKRQANPASNR